MTYKSDIGQYSYTKAHQVSNAGNRWYLYDENGNMTNNNGNKIDYSSFNKPIYLENDNISTQFFYDARNTRYKKIDSIGKSKVTTHYLGKTYEEDVEAGMSRYFIYANGQVVSIFTKRRNYETTKYLHYDSLNSVDTITKEDGTVEERMAYKPFGEKINLNKNAKERSKESFTNRGYTGHEHIKKSSLIHMNGRVYDSAIARFLTADPNIFHPFDPQDFNRYAYVRNNPLKYTDPSGFEMNDDGMGDSDADADDDGNGTNSGGSNNDESDGDGGDGSGSGGSVDNDAAIDAAIAAAEASVAQNRENNKAGGFNTNDYSGDGGDDGGLNTVVVSIVAATPIGGFDISFGFYTNSKVNGFTATAGMAYGKDAGLDITETYYDNPDTSQLTGEFNAVEGSLGPVEGGAVFDKDFNHIGTSVGSSWGPPGVVGHVTHGWGVTFGERINNTSTELTLSP